MVVPQEALFENVNGISGQTVGTYDERFALFEAKPLQEQVAVEYAYEADFQTLMQKLLDGSYTAIFVPAANMIVLKRLLIQLRTRKAAVKHRTSADLSSRMKREHKPKFCIRSRCRLKRRTRPPHRCNQGKPMSTSWSDMSGSSITNRTDVNISQRSTRGRMRYC
ncbi:MAG: hypothetical protein ACLRWH_03890 [Emergencia sp.]